MIRFSGHLRLRATAHANGHSLLSEQSFRAPFHISKPYWDQDTRTLVVQVVNPTAGILDGDELRSEIALERGAALLVTTPSANRVFSMAHRGAISTQQFKVAAGAWLEVAPEPLVPHRGARFRQSTHVAVESGGGLFLVDQLMPGRVAYGEAWSWDDLRLELTVSVAGELVLRERLVQSGETLRKLSIAFGCGTCACFANAVFIPPSTPGDSNWMDAVRALHRDGVWIGISPLRKAGYAIKIVAPGALPLRDTLAAVRESLGTIAPSLRCRVRKQ